MTADKILYVDDEPMALKYFERLVSPLAPVITASSVEQGKAILRERGAEIAVLVSDQRMPGAHGNELLRFARDGVQRGEDREVREAGGGAIGGGGLWHVAEQPAHLVSVLDHVIASHGGAPRGGRQQGNEHLDGGAFARAIGPQQAEHLTLVNSQVYTIHRREVAIQPP